MIDDLPTPPLPLPTAITRVVGETSVGGADCDACEPGPLHDVRALLLGHLVVLDADLARRPGGPATFELHVVADLAPERAGGGRERDLDDRRRRRGSTATSWTMPEVDDRGAELGIEDAREDAADVVGRRGRAPEVGDGGRDACVIVE